MTADDPHLEDKGIGSTDNQLHQPSPPESLKPPLLLITRLFTKHQDYKKLSTDLRNLQETSLTIKPTDLLDF